MSGDAPDVHWVLWPLAGILGAVALVRLARAGGIVRERRWFAVGLVVAALVYVIFAVIDADPRAVATESLGLVIFAGVALLGWRRRPFFLVAGWVLHVGWDVGVHLVMPARYVGAWYPMTCIGFDLVVAGYLAWHLAQGGPRRKSDA